MTGQSDTMVNTMPDEEIIRRILGGEKKLFEVLIRKYNQRLYRVGISVLRDETETEDAMQTTYISAYEHLPSFESRSSFGTWLTRIMLNQCFQQKRKKKLVYTGLEQLDNVIHMQTPVSELVNKELSGVLERAVSQLPEKIPPGFCAARNRSNVCARNIRGAEY